MRWRAVLAIALAASSAMAAAAPRAIWVWEADTRAMLEDRAAADRAIEFLRAKKLDCVYLYADAFEGRNLLVERPEAYGALIRRLRAQGIRSYALLGSWFLHTEQYVLPERHADAVAMLRRVLAYNARSKEDARFDGVSLDIEPHLLDQWDDAHKAALLRDFLDLGRLLMQAKRDAGAGLPLGPAVPFWLDGITLDWQGARKPVSEHVLDTYDYAALMDYRDHAAGGDGLIEHARSEMSYAAGHGKRVVIGVDVSPGEPQKVSFNHLGEADLERELAATAEAYRGNPAFAGFAIHHLGAYREWLARPASPSDPAH